MRKTKETQGFLFKFNFLGQTHYTNLYQWKIRNIYSKEILESENNNKTECAIVNNELVKYNKAIQFGCIKTKEQEITSPNPACNIFIEFLALTQTI